jgi:hypothetical protein
MRIRIAPAVFGVAFTLCGPWKVAAATSPTATPIPSVAPTPHRYLFSSNAELQTAIGAWCDNSTRGEAMYGDISDWDTRGITSMKDLIPLYCAGDFTVEGSYNVFTFNADIHSWNVCTSQPKSRLRPSLACLTQSLSPVTPPPTPRFVHRNRFPVLSRSKACSEDH